MILEGEKYHVESFNQFMDRFGVSGEGLFRNLPEDDQDRIVDEFNDLAEEEGYTTVSSIGDLPEWVFDNWPEHVLWKSDNQLFIDYLEQKDEVFTHLRVGGNHLVVHITDDREQVETMTAN